MKKVLLIVLLMASISYGTVSSGETVREFFTCNGSATTFTFTIPCYSASEIYVYKQLISTGVPELLIKDTDYTITYTGSSYLEGGVITITPAIESTYKIAVERKITNTQETVPAAINSTSTVAGLDKLQRITQDLWDRNSRSLRLPDTDPACDMNLPNYIDRANTWLGFDENGVPTVTNAQNAQPVEINDVNVTSYIQTLFDDNNSAEARATLDIYDDFVDIRSYGAVGDGITDDTNGLVAALAAGKPIYAPAGIYRLTAKVDIPDRTIMEGDFRFAGADGGVTIFYGDHNDTVFEIEGYGYGIHLSGFTITKYGSTYQDTGTGIKIYSISGVNSLWQLNDVDVSYCNNGIEIQDAVYPSLTRIAITHANDTALWLHNEDAGTGNHHGIFNTLWLSSNQYGIVLEGENYFHNFNNIKLFGSSIFSIFADEDTTLDYWNNSFENCWFESNTMLDGMIYLGKGRNWKFDKIFISQNDKTLFDSNIPQNVAREISVSDVLDTGNKRGNLGIGYLKTTNCGNTAKRSDPLRGRLTDNIDIMRGSNVIFQRRTIRGESITAHDIITPTYQAGIKRTNYATDQNMAGWTKTNMTITGGQADPYGGSNAYLFNPASTANSATKTSITVDGVALANRTFTVQAWVKSFDANSVVRLRLAPVSDGNYAENQWFLDKNEWTLVWTTLDCPSTTTATTLISTMANAADANFYMFEPCIYEADKPCISTTASEPSGLTAGKPFERSFGTYSLGSEHILSITNVNLAANANTILYTVPTGKRCVLTKAILVVGADAGTTTISIGQSSALTDFVGTSTLSNINAQYDVAILTPVPNATPVLSKSYAAATVIKANVGSHAGGGTNTLYLFGILY